MNQFNLNRIALPTALRAVVIGALLTLPLWATPSFAEQSFKVKSNGLIVFEVSTTEVNRLRFVNDKPGEIYHNDSSLEFIDGNRTGDLFFAKRQGANNGIERGYIVTQKGKTLRYEMRPTSQPVDDVVITLTGPSRAYKSTFGIRHTQQRPVVENFNPFK